MYPLLIPHYNAVNIQREETNVKQTAGPIAIWRHCIAHRRLVCFPLVVKRHLTPSTKSPFEKAGIQNKTAAFSEAKFNMGLKLNYLQVESSLEKLIHGLNT